MSKKCILALLFLLPATSMAADLGRAFMCDLPASKFFEVLVQRNMIDIKAYANLDSVSYFHPKIHLFKKSENLLAFGMQVDAVFGYATGQVFFRRIPGTEPPDVYGVVVREGLANTQAQLNSMGASRAIARRLTSSTTEITCEGV